MSVSTYPRLNIYLDEEDLRTRVKVAAARHGVTVSSYCVQAIRDRLEAEEAGPTRRLSPSAAARRMDQRRQKIGPIGVSVSELIRQGRRR